jgi:hypothetical protein
MVDKIAPDTPAIAFGWADRGGLLFGLEESQVPFQEMVKGTYKDLRGKPDDRYR